MDKQKYEALKKLTEDFLENFHKLSGEKDLGYAIRWKLTEILPKCKNWEEKSDYLIFPSGGFETNASKHLTNHRLQGFATSLEACIAKLEKVGNAEEDFFELVVNTLEYEEDDILSILERLPRKTVTRTKTEKSFKIRLRSSRDFGKVVITYDNLYGDKLAGFSFIVKSKVIFKTFSSTDLYAFDEEGKLTGETKLTGEFFDLADVPTINEMFAMANWFAKEDY